MTEKAISYCVVPFTPAQRQNLKDLSRVQPEGKEYPAAPNKMLDDYIDALKDMYPEMFQPGHSRRHSR